MIFAVQMWSTPATPIAQGQRPLRVDVRAWNAAASGRADVLVQAVRFADTSAARDLRSKTARVRYVYEALTQHAASAQGALLNGLRSRGLTAQSLWISNQVWVRGATQADLAWLAARPDVAQVELDVQMRGALGRPELPRAFSPLGVEWGVSRVRAPEVWAQGFTGQGVVVADLDTGVKWDHATLKPKYRGWDGVAATHDYNWYDAAGHSVAAPQLAPYDDNGHGTHTIGTVLGDDGGSNQIGVAPGAKWIGCRNMYNGVGSVARYIACFQFALAPTDVQGANADPSLAADITTNSWGCDPGWGEEGCEVPSALVTTTQVMRDAGVMTVAAAGNEGSSCGTVQNAPGTLDEAFSVGATDSGNAIAGFSSRGPSTFTGRMKPDLAAPGVSVRSAHGSGYANLSGTSMATPHVAGVVALLWSAAPELRGEVDATEALLRRTAAPLTTAQTCGGVAGSSVPNNTFGHGLIDARAALSQALQLRDRVEYSAPTVVTGLVDIPLVITYTNTSLAVVSDAIVTATLPTSVELIDYTPGAEIVAARAWASGAATSAAWRLDVLASGESKVLTLTVRSSAYGAVGLTNLRFSDSTGGVQAALHEETPSTVVVCTDACPTPTSTATPTCTATPTTGATETSTSTPTPTQVNTTTSTGTPTPILTETPTATAMTVPAGTGTTTPALTIVAPATATGTPAPVVCRIWVPLVGRMP